MDLLDRYLGAVAALLPAAQRQDIVAELRDLLESRIDEKAAELGRPLGKAEMEALLNGFGHPLAVAGRYGPQRALIGVELYPYWLFALKAALAVAAFVSLIPALVQMATTDWDVSRAFSHALAGFLPFALQLVGVITLIGAAVERGWIKTVTSASGGCRTCRRYGPNAAGSRRRPASRPCSSSWPAGCSSSGGSGWSSFRSPRWPSPATTG